MVELTVDLSPQEELLIASIAAAEGVSPEEALRRAVVDYLARAARRHDLLLHAEPTGESVRRLEAPPAP
jgi:hypothetical protein